MCTSFLNIWTCAHFPRFLWLCMMTGMTSDGWWYFGGKGLVLRAAGGCSLRLCSLNREVVKLSLKSANTVTHSQLRSENKVFPKNCLVCALLFLQGVHLVCFKLRQGTKCSVDNQISHWSCLPGTCILNRCCISSESQVNKQTHKTWHGNSEENRLR